jgi:predicted RNA-binding Zn ribbon-like protein
MDDGTVGLRIEDMDLVGGELCLDFVNTANLREGGPLRDRLRVYGDLVRWGERTGALDVATAKRLLLTAGRDPAEAERVLERSRTLREAMYRVFHRWRRAEAPAPEDVELVSRAGAEATAAQQLVTDADGFELHWPETDALDRVWWPAATSAVALLLSPDLARVKECGADDCDWLFLDVSRNRSRRWCDMKECGNRAKARRHYARRAGSGKASS